MRPELYEKNKAPYVDTKCRNHSSKNGDLVGSGGFFTDFWRRLLCDFQKPATEVCAPQLQQRAGGGHIRRHCEAAVAQGGVGVPRGVEAVRGRRGHRVGAMRVAGLGGAKPGEPVNSGSRTNPRQPCTHTAVGKEKSHGRIFFLTAEKCFPTAIEKNRPLSLLGSPRKQKKFQTTLHLAAA